MKYQNPTGMKAATVVQLKELIGNSRFNSMLKNAWFKRYVYSNEQAYRVGVDSLGYFEVEVYPYHSMIHRTESGKIRPEMFIRFHFAGYNVTQAHLFRRLSKDSDNWIFFQSQKDF